jgi:hypothetical protein
MMQWTFLPSHLHAIMGDLLLAAADFRMMMMMMMATKTKTTSTQLANHPNATTKTTKPGQAQDNQ